MPAPHRVPGHFGEWLEGRLGPGGPLVLITLPCPALAVTATRIGNGPFALEQPDPPVLTTDLAERFLLALGVFRVGRFQLSFDMPPGGGAGASTAALVSLARAAGSEADERSLARACLDAEGASDPLMLAEPDRRLWAPREARALRRLPPVPPCAIVGGFLGPPERTDPADLRFPDIADLVARWERASGLAAFAALAAASAERTTVLRGPEGDPTPSLARSLGAMGHVRAHTGSARGLVFAPGTVPAEAGDALREAGFASVLRFGTGW